MGLFWNGSQIRNPFCSEHDITFDDENLHFDEETNLRDST